MELFKLLLRARSSAVAPLPYASYGQEQELHRHELIKKAARDKAAASTLS
jgi:hypothetical protein